MSTPTTNITLSDFLIKYSTSPYYFKIRSVQEDEYLTDTHQKISKYKHHDLTQYIKEHSEDGVVSRVEVFDVHGSAFRTKEMCDINLTNSPIQQMQLEGISAPIYQPQTNIPTHQKNANMEGQSQFLQFINTTLQGELSLSKSELQDLKLKYNTLYEKYMELKTDHATSDQKNQIALSGIEMQAKNQNVFLEILKPENSEGIANLISAFKGDKSTTTSEPWRTGLSSDQKDNVIAIVNHIKDSDNETQEAILTLAIIAQKEPSYIKELVTKVKLSAEQQPA